MCCMGSAEFLIMRCLLCGVGGEAYRRKKFEECAMKEISGLLMCVLGLWSEDAGDLSKDAPKKVLWVFSGDHRRNTRLMHISLPGP